MAILFYIQIMSQLQEEASQQMKKKVENCALEEASCQEEQILTQKLQKVVVDQKEIQPISEQFVNTNMQLAQNSKKQGNNYFKNGEYCEAIGKYQQCLRHTPKQQQKFRCILYSNMSICFSKLQNHKESITYCKKAISCDDSYEKAQLNLASSYQKNDNLEQALLQYKKIAPKYPNQLKYALKMSQLQKKIDEKNQKMKNQAIDGLKNIGNSLLGYFGLSLDNFKMQQGQNGGYSVSFKK